MKRERENNDQGGITSYRPRGSEGKLFAASFDFISIIDTIVFLWRSFFLFIYLFYFSLFILFFARFSLILNFRKKKKKLFKSLPHHLKTYVFSRYYNNCAILDEARFKHGYNNKIEIR